MKLHGRIPVEPLDDTRLTNIERRLVVGVSELAEHRPGVMYRRVPRRILAFAGVSVAVAAAAVIGWKLHAPAAMPAQPALAQTQHFSIDTTTRQGYSISMLALDDAMITYGDGQPAKFDVTRTDGRVVVEMKRGKLDLAVKHVPGRVLVIRAGDTDIEDIGTRFSVDYDGTSAVDVRVTEGEVKVSRRAQEVRVAAGKAWTTDRGLVALAELDKPPVVAIVTPTPAPAPNTMPDHEAAVPTPAPPAPHPVAHVVRPATPAAPIARPAMPTIQSVDPYIELRSAIRKQPLAFDPKVDGKADAATEIAKLKKIAYSPTTVGDEASQAFYQIAVLLYRPLGQDAEAMRTLEMYLRRFTGGPQRSAALWLRVRIACSHAIDDDCRRAAYGYQHEVTTGEASEVAVRITNAQ